MREIIPITSEAQWLALRDVDITSTMSPALFEMSPYLTPFELYHAKKNSIQVPFESNERMEKGLRMERYAANEVAHRLSEEIGAEVTAHKINDYIRIPEIRMGSSFDYELRCSEWDAPRLLELKAVDYFRWKDAWTEDDAPDDKEIQIQHQFECADKYERGYIAVFTGIYDVVLYERERDREFGAALRSAITKFWSDVKDGNEPKPDFYRDAPVIAELFNSAGGDAVDKTGDAELEALLAKHKRLSAEKTQAEKDADAVKAKIHMRLANAGGCFTQRFKATTTWTKGSAGTVVTEDMVGTVIGERKPYRQLRITDLTEKRSKS